MTPNWILLIDPFKNLLNAYRMILEGEQYQVDTVNHVKEIYPLFEQKTYSAVITEYLPPFEVTEEMLKWIKEKSPEIYILMVTNASIDEEIYEKLFNLGVDDFILKPYSPQKIIIHLRKGLRQRELLSQLQALNKLNLLHPMTRTIGDLVYNQVFFKRCLRQELKKARRHHHAFSILLIRISTQEKTGELHDQCYAELLKMIRKIIREEDIMARNNGEITLLLPDTDQTGSEALKMRLSELIQHHPSHIPYSIYEEMVKAISFQNFTYPDQFELPKSLRDIFDGMNNEFLAN